MAGCGKVCGAFTACCSTGQTNGHHHYSHTPNPFLPTCDQKAQKAKEVAEMRQHHHVSKPHGKLEAQKSELGTNERFSDYIKRAKMKIRALTMVHGGNRNGSSHSKADDVHGSKSEDHTKDTFSEYIKGVKIKIRKTTTNIGSRKSFKGHHGGETG